MNILVVNDDGINAKGISLLVEAVKEYGNVFVVAPKVQQSAVSQGITIHEPLEIDEEKNKFTNVRAWSISGKPADCVKVALEYLRLDIDLCVSGVNDGPNLGTDILYSGTVAGATEASIFGLPSIAFSTDFGAWAIVEKELKKTFDYIFTNKLTRNGLVLNVNLPLHDFDESKGFKLTKQGYRNFSTKFRHDNGKYWQEGGWVKTENLENTDVYAVENGYTSITPIGIDRTSYAFVEELQKDFK